jgi:hypothetical protein
MRRRILFLVMSIAGASCHAASPASDPGGNAAGPVDAGPGPSLMRDWASHPAIFTQTGAREIDVLGDLHGDLGAAVRILAAAGLVTPVSPFHWTGATATLVVVGDVIDKGMMATALIDLFMSLEDEARAAGGRVVVTLGNHEAEFLAEPTASKSSVFQAELRLLGLDPVKVATGASRYGVWLLTRPVAALVDGWFFSHAGNSDGDTAAKLTTKFQTLFESKDAAGVPLVFSDSFLAGSNSLLEANLWWETSRGSTAEIDADLVALPARHIVFGHEPGEVDFPDDRQGHRDRGTMVMRYEGRLFLVDVGMSSAVGYSSGALLRITRDGTERATALYPDGTSRPLWP